jgi:hypothetical protein
LFLSVHANASPNTALRGVEIYYLNNTDNRGTLRLAAMENNLHWDPHDPKLAGEIPDLSYILSDLRQTYKVEESKQLAEQLQGAVVSRLGAEWDGVEDLGVPASSSRSPSSRTPWTGGGSAPRNISARSPRACTRACGGTSRRPRSPRPCEYPGGIAAVGD